MNFAQKRILTAAFAIFCFAGAWSQSISIGLDAGPGLQTIEETEAVLSSGWQVAILPQASLRVRYRKGEIVGWRFGLQFLQKGARIPAVSSEFPDAPAGTGFLVVQGTFGVANLGISAGTDLGDDFRLEGFLDLAGGIFLFGSYRNTLYPRGHPGRLQSVSNLFNSSYLGIHLGPSLAWSFAPQCRIYLQPTLEAQLNNAFRSSVFVPRFVGFSPLIGFSYDLQ